MCAREALFIFHVFFFPVCVRIFHTLTFQFATTSPTHRAGSATSLGYGSQSVFFFSPPFFSVLFKISQTHVHERHICTVKPKGDQAQCAFFSPFFSIGPSVLREQKITVVFFPHLCGRARAHIFHFLFILFPLFFYLRNERTLFTTTCPLFVNLKKNSFFF